MDIIIFYVQFDKLGKVGDRYIILNNNPTTGSSTLTLSKKQQGAGHGTVDPFIQDIIVYTD